MPQKQKKALKQVQDPRWLAIKEARRQWLGKTVQFDPKDGTGVQIGIVVLVTRFSEIYVSYNFDEDGCYTLPVCTIDEAPKMLTLV